mgnify:CR=1 FL=1
MYLCKRKANKFRNLATLIFLNIAILSCSFSPVNSDSEIIVSKLKFELSVPEKIKNNLSIFVKENEASSKEVNILKFEEWGIPKYHELVLVTSEEYLKNNPETVDDFVDAFSRGYQSSIQNNDASMESLISAFPEVNVELETKGIKLLSPLWKESLDSDGMESWIKFGDWMKDKGLISESLDVEKSIMK